MRFDQELLQPFQILGNPEILKVGKNLFPKKCP